MAKRFAEEPFGAEVRRLLHDRRMTQKELAELADVDMGYLSRALRAVEPASLDLISRVARALDLAEDYFLEIQRARLLEWLESSAGETRHAYSRYIRLHEHDVDG